METANRGLSRGCLIRPQEEAAVAVCAVPVLGGMPEIWPRLQINGFWPSMSLKLIAQKLLGGGTMA